LLILGESSKFVDEPQKTIWPDVTVGLTILTAVVFLASLLFVSGLSLGLQHNLLGLCDLSDYLRVAPSWALPTLGVLLLQIIAGWGRYGSAAQEQERKMPQSRAEHILFKWRDLDTTKKLRILVSVGVVGMVAHAFWLQPWLVIFPLLAFPIAFQLSFHNVAPGWIRLFQLPSQCDFFIPQIVLILGLSFFMGIYWMPILTL
jgi:hypothetical protein